MLGSLNSDSNHAWEKNTALPLTKETLFALFEGTIPAIVIPSALSTTDCEKIVQNLKSLGMGTYSHVNHAVGRLGLCQMEYHLKNKKEEYFKKVEETVRIYKQAVNGAIDPIEKLFQLFQDIGENA